MSVHLLEGSHGSSAFPGLTYTWFLLISTMFVLNDYSNKLTC